MYILDDISNAFKAVKRISAYAYYLTEFINQDISKYKTLLNFRIQIGCCVGEFYDFIFKTNVVEEETSIGFAANYAAKLQGLTREGYLSISSNMYNQLEADIKAEFEVKTSPEIEKYQQYCYYTVPLSAFKIETKLDEELSNVRAYANRVNLSDINVAPI